MNYVPVIIVAVAACFAVNQTHAQLFPNSTLKDQSRFSEPQPPPPPCTKRCILPPKEFDHAYTGKLTIDTAGSQDELKEFCGTAYKPGLTLGCARPNFAGAGTCRIVMVPESIIITGGWTKELMLRHEIGHCNGWPGHHPGQRRYDADETEAGRHPISPVWRYFE